MILLPGQRRKGMLSFELGGAGTGKSQALMEKIIQCLDAEQDALVIVPDQYSFEYDKKLYNFMGAQRYNRVTVLSFARLAEAVFVRHGRRPGEYAGELTKISMMYRAVTQVQKNDSLLYYDRQARSPLFVDSVLQIVKELRWSNIPPEELEERLPFLEENVRDKIHDLSVLYSVYSRLLEENGYKDSLGDVAEAAQTAGRMHYFKGTAVFLDAFQSFSGDELSMVDAVLSDAPAVHIALTLEGTPGLKSSLFALTQDTFHALCTMAKEYGHTFSYTLHEEPVRFRSEELAFLSRNLFRPVRGQMETSPALRLAEAAEVYTEADFICTEIRRLVTEEGYRFSDIALLSRNLPDSVHVLEGAFLRYDIPYFLDMNQPVMHKALILLVLSVFDASINTRPDTEAVFRYAKSGLLGIPYSQISMLENYCYKWNVEGAMWLEDFPPKDDLAESVNTVRQKIIQPLWDFKRAAQNASGAQVCEALYALFTAIGLDRNISGLAASIEAQASGRPEDAQTENLLIAREHKQLWNTLMEILETMHGTLGDVPVSLKDFRDLLRLMLMGSTYASPPQTLDSVTVSAAERARLADPKVVFVLGVNEGVFPGAAKASGLFSDKDRAQLEKAGLKLSVTPKLRQDEERFMAYSALSSASERLYITYPLSDAGGKARFPSYILEQIQKMFPGNTVLRMSELPELYFCTTEKAAYYRYVQSLKRSDGDSAVLRAFLLERENYREKVDYLDRVQETVSQEIADAEVALQLFGKKMHLSASRFEDYSKCPFSYFCKKGLKLFPRQKVEFNPLEQGNAIHRCLYDVFRQYPGGEFAVVQEAALRACVEASLAAYYIEALGGDFGKSERFKKSYQKLEDSVMELLLHMQEELAQSGFIPSDYELKIAEHGDVEPTRLISESGSEVAFIGTVDRVDTFDKDGKTYVRVVDYKTGSKVFRMEDVLYGVNMQMLLYLFTLTENGKKYADPQPAGVLYMPSGELEASLPRRSDEGERSSFRDKAFKMNGIVLDEEDIIEAMEEGVQGIYIPVKKTREGFAKTSSLISRPQIERLKKHAQGLLLDMAEKLHAGKVPALPLADGKRLPCDYCDYWSVCGNEGRQSRPYAADSGELMQAILDGEGDKAHG